MSANVRIVTLACIGFLALAPAARAEGIDSIMLRDPDFAVPKVVPAFADNLLPLWLELLARPETDHKVRAAGTIAAAHRRGMKGLEKAVPKLVDELEKKDLPAAVRVALVGALADLDAKSAAAAMFRASADGDIDVRQIVDPCLTRWLYEPVRAAWLERIQAKPSQRGTILAIRGLLAARDERAIPRLREIAMAADELPPVRLEAAAAAADLKRSGFEADAKQLASEAGLRGTVSRVVAATLLRHHDGDTAIALLQAFVKDPEPTVAARAMTRIVELDPKHVVPVLESALANPDAAVRLLAVAALDRAPSDAYLRRLGDRLADVHPDVRTAARLSLFKHFARPEWKDAVRREGTRILDGQFWGGLQQAALLLGQIDHKPAVDRLLELQDHARSEVFVTAAWAFRVLNIPAKADAAFAVFNRRLRLAADKSKPAAFSMTRGQDEQLSQLAQYLGVQKYAPASAAFRRLIPANSGPMETRAAAIWALGKIHEGQRALGFESALEVRLNAVGPLDVEFPIVRRMCAVTLARVNAKDEIKSLRLNYSGKPVFDAPSNACGWALEKMTGEKVPAPVDQELPQINFFATPIERKAP